MPYSDKATGLEPGAAKALNALLQEQSKGLPLKLAHDMGPPQELRYSSKSNSRFPSNPLITRVAFFMIFSFNKENPKQKSRNGYYRNT